MLVCEGEVTDGVTVWDGDVVDGVAVCPGVLVDGVPVVIPGVPVLLVPGVVCAPGAGDPVLPPLVCAPATLRARQTTNTVIRKCRCIFEGLLEIISGLLLSGMPQAANEFAGEQV